MIPSIRFEMAHAPSPARSLCLLPRFSQSYPLTRAGPSLAFPGVPVGTLRHGALLLPHNDSEVDGRGPEAIRRAVRARRPALLRRWVGRISREHRAPQTHACPLHLERKNHWMHLSFALCKVQAHIRRWGGPGRIRVDDWIEGKGVDLRFLCADKGALVTVMSSGADATGQKQVHKRPVRPFTYV